MIYVSVYYLYLNLFFGYSEQEIVLSAVTNFDWLTNFDIYIRVYILHIN